jgi:hypothetical protein
MTTRITPRHLVLGLFGLGAVEAIATTVVARDPDPAQWDALTAALHERGDGDPVLVATRWLSPIARRHVPDAAELRTLGLADLHGIGRFHTIAWRSDGRDAIADLLEALPEPVVEASQAFGPLQWTTWRQDHAGTIVTDLGAIGSRATVRTQSGVCRGRGSVRCSEGEVEPRIVEVDYRPRSCLGISVTDGTTVTLAWSGVELGDTLRGHVGFGDYNARLRNDAPARLVVRIDGDEVLRRTVSDQEGWRAFAIATTPGIASVEIDVTSGLSGTFGPSGYDGTPSRTTCIEARAIAGTDRAGAG